MPFALLIVGIVLVTAGVRGTTSELASLIKGDFTGEKNFSYWLIAILVIGSIGYVEDLRSLSRMFLVLLIVALFLTNKGGVFQQFAAQAYQPTTTATAAAAQESDSYAGLTPQ